MQLQQPSTAYCCATPTIGVDRLTAMVLLLCRDSKVFKPTNPMVSGILSLLAELHAMKGLKINNAFSIELIFKAFNLQVADFKPADLLRGLSRQALQNPDWSIDSLPQQQEQSGAPSQAQSAGQAGSMGLGALDKGGAGAGAPGMPLRQSPAAGGAVQGSMDGKLPGTASPGEAGVAGAGAGGMGGMGVSPGTPGTPVPGSGLPAYDPNMLPSLTTQCVINPSLGPLADRLALKRNVPMAMERAIVEIITPVVERSVTIACYTTFELVQKVRE